MSLDALGIKTKITKEDVINSLRTDKPVLTGKLVTMADERDEFVRCSLDNAGLGKLNEIKNMHDSLVHTIPVNEGDSPLKANLKGLANVWRFEKINPDDSCSEINRKKIHNLRAAFMNPIAGAIKVYDPRYTPIGMVPDFNRR